MWSLCFVFVIWLVVQAYDLLSMAEKRSKRERKVRSNTVSCVIEIFTAFGEKIVIELFAALATAHTKAFMKTMC